MDPTPQFFLGFRLVSGFCLVSAALSLEAARTSFVPVAAVRPFRAAFPIRLLVWLQEPQSTVCFPHRPLVTLCLCASLVGFGKRETLDCSLEIEMPYCEFLLEGRVLDALDHPVHAEEAS